MRLPHLCEPKRGSVRPHARCFAVAAPCRLPRFPRLLPAPLYMQAILHLFEPGQAQANKAAGCSGPQLLLLQEQDPAFFLGLGRAKDGAFVAVSSNSKTCSEVGEKKPCCQR